MFLFDFYHPNIVCKTLSFLILLSCGCTSKFNLTWLVPIFQWRNLRSSLKLRPWFSHQFDQWHYLKNKSLKESEIVIPSGQVKFLKNLTCPAPTMVAPHESLNSWDHWKMTNHFIEAYFEHWYWGLETPCLSIAWLELNPLMVTNCLLSER